METEFVVELYGVTMMVRHNAIPATRIQEMTLELDIIPSSGQTELKCVRQIHSQ